MVDIDALLSHLAGVDFTSKTERIIIKVRTGVAASALTVNPRGHPDHLRLAASDPERVIPGWRPGPERSENGGGAVGIPVNRAPAVHVGCRLCARGSVRVKRVLILSFILDSSSLSPDRPAANFPLRPPTPAARSFLLSPSYIPPPSLISAYFHRTLTIPSTPHLLIACTRHTAARNDRLNYP